MIDDFLAEDESHHIHIKETIKCDWQGLLEAAKKILGEENPYYVAARDALRPAHDPKYYDSEIKASLRKSSELSVEVLQLLKSSGLFNPGSKSTVMRWTTIHFVVERRNPPTRHHLAETVERGAEEAARKVANR